MSSIAQWGPTGKTLGTKNTGYQNIISPTQNQGQNDLSQMLMQALQKGGGFQKGLGNLSSLAGGDQSQFDAMEAPALRQQGALQGNLASRFSGGFGQGGSGMRHSSGFRNTMSEANTDLAERLQGNRMNLQQNALQQLMGLSDSLLNRPTFQSGFAQKQTPFLQQLLLALTGHASQMGSSMATSAAMGAAGL